jgi:LEA14-like dessication related protein
MRNSSEGDRLKKTQADMSAFFCLRKELSLIVILLAFGSSAQAQTPVNKKPDLHLNGVSIEKVDWSKRTVETKLTIVVDNSGPAFTIKDLSYRIKLNDTLAGEGKYEREINVSAESSATFDLPCTVDLSAVPGIAWGIVAGGFDVHYVLETEFTLPILPSLSPRIKTAIDGDLSLASTVEGWTAKIKDRISKE